MRQGTTAHRDARKGGSVRGHVQVHKQLVKGNDDLRQDAVMQQFFQLVNSLLAADAGAARRGLRMATYRVVAFSGVAGMLQWLDNTISLNEYLCGTSKCEGAHVRYARPGYANVLGVPQALRGVHKREKSRRVWLKEYKRVEDTLPPVLRRFFVERYHEPALWCVLDSTAFRLHTSQVLATMRGPRLHRISISCVLPAQHDACVSCRLQKHQAFAKSVAVSSMAGYVIGLGDRHCSNILIDSCTAEVVQIDLGIAFEAGRLLPQPELVPFRLTRDVVDGLGIAGVEGVPRRCAEAALAVMRLARHAIITIVEVR